MQSKKTLKIYLALFLAGSVFFLSSQVRAGLTGTLSWEPGDQSSNIAQYKVYFGQQSGNYTKSLEVDGHRTSVEVPGLKTKTIYFFAVKAVDKYGHESDFSCELAVYTPRSKQHQKEILTLQWNEQEYLQEHPKALEAVQDGKMDSGFEYYLKNEYMQPGLESASYGKRGISSGTPSVKEAQNLLFGLGSYSRLKGWIGVTDLEYNLSNAFQVSWPEYIKDSGETRVCTGDIDGDGKDEVIIGLGSGKNKGAVPGGRFEILDQDYSHLGWGQVQWPAYNELNGETWPATGDLDGDGRDEILIGLGEQGQGAVEVFEFSNNQIRHRSWAQSSWNSYNQALGQIRPATGDLNGDSLDEILLGFGPVNMDSQLSGGRLEILNGQSFSNLAWGKLDWPEYNSLNGELTPATGDLNADGQDEVLLGLGPGGKGKLSIMHYRFDGLTPSSWAEPIYSLQHLSLSSMPVAGDLDKDKLDEILMSYDSDSRDWISYFDDQFQDFSYMQDVELLPEKYGISDGRIWLAIQFSRK